MKVLVTGAGPGGHGEQLVKALKGSRLNRYEVHTADANSRLASAGDMYSHTLPLASSPVYIEELLELCRVLEVDALFHGSEPEMIAISRNRSLFERRGIFVAMNRAEVIELCMDKGALSQRLENIGFPVPRFKETINQEFKVDESWYPVIVKPQFGGGGSRDVYICQNESELEAILVYLTASHPDKRVVIQEYVGSPFEEFTVGILHDSTGRFLGSAVMNRDLSSTLSVRQRVTNVTPKHKLGAELVVSSGVSQGVLADFPTVADQCREIAEALESRGPLNIQLRLVEGKVLVFEINPRFSGTTSIRALAGFNEPDILLQSELLGVTFEEPFHPKPGQLVRRLHETFTPDELGPA
jgi:carbamoyl-phosphate synthase large subunit